MRAAVVSALVLAAGVSVKYVHVPRYLSLCLLFTRGSAAKHGHQVHIGHLADHVTNVAGAVEAVGNAHAALHSRCVMSLRAVVLSMLRIVSRSSEDGLYARSSDDDLYARALEARNRHKLHIGHIAEHVTNIAGAVEAVGNAHAAIHSRYATRHFTVSVYAEHDPAQLRRRPVRARVRRHVLRSRIRRGPVRA